MPCGILNKLKNIMAYTVVLVQIVDGVQGKAALKNVTNFIEFC